MNKLIQKDQDSKSSNFIFCDGASKGNPGPGGWASVVVKNGHVQELGGGEKNTTNNRMELTAALNGLQNFFSSTDVSVSGEKFDKEFNGDLTIYTDSSYVINGISKWVSGWKRNGWITKTKESVLHRDLWEGISNIQDVYGSGKNGKGKISWVHVKGHSGIPLNERCDEIATGFAEVIVQKNSSDSKPDSKSKLAGEPELFSGPREDYKISTELITKSAYENSDSTHSSHTSHDAQKAKKSRSQAKAFSYVSLVGGKVEVHQDWASCEKRVKGASGAKFKKVFSKAEELELVKEFTGK